MIEPKNPYKVKSARFDAWNDGYDLGYECGISEGEAGIVEVLDDYEKLQAEIIKLKQNWIDMKGHLEDMCDTYIEHDRRSEYELCNFLRRLMLNMEKDGDKNGEE